MYSKQEASQLRQEFWTTFGKYMMPIPSAEGEKVNWVNYKTGEKNIFFKMDAGSKVATISVLISHKEHGIRHLYYQQFLEFRNLFCETLGEEWTWQKDHLDENAVLVSRIYKEQQGNIYDKQNWPSLISFFKPRIISLDEFWSTVKYGFEALR